MSWIVQNWQLKLLALVLSLGLFAAVAFQQNPPSQQTINASIEYDGLPATQVLVRSPLTQPVTVTGLAEALKLIRPGSVTVRVDASRLKKGSQVVYGHPKIVTPSVRSLDDPIPLNITVDERSSVTVSVDARITYAEGWKPVPDKIVVSPQKLTFVGSAAELKDIQAFVAPTQPIAASTADIPSLPIQLETGGRVIPLPNDTFPATTVDSPLNASLHIEAQRPNQTRRVPVLETPTGTPAPGYRITAITFDQLFVDISGSADDLANVNSINLPAISVDGANATITRTVRVSTLPANITSSVGTIAVTIVIQKNPAIPTPSPSP